MSWEITLIGVEDTLNAQTAPQVKERLKKVLDRTGPVVLDLRAVSMDSTGLGTVLSLQRKLELQNRPLMVISTDPYFYRLLAVTGVDATLCVVRDVDEAISRARSKRLVSAA